MNTTKEYIHGTNKRTQGVFEDVKVNIIVGVASIVMLGATFFVGEFSARYTFQAIVEGVLMALIVWLAWRWPKQERVEGTP